MIAVHHLNNSRSQRVLRLLEELGIPYKIRKYERDPRTMLAPPALTEVHPLGKSPVITDGDITLAESGAIIEYRVERYDDGRLAPPIGTPERLRWRYWLHFAEGSATTPRLIKLICDQVAKAPMPFFARPVARAMSARVQAMTVEPNLKRQWDFMESELTQHKWFAGSEFSAADIQKSFPPEAAAQRGGLDANWPKLLGYLKRIHARPAYKRALKAGGPYTFAEE